MYQKEELFNRNVGDIMKNSGVYFLFNKHKQLVYVGKADNIRQRMGTHYWTFYYFKNRVKNGWRGFSTDAKPFEYFRFSIMDIYMAEMTEHILIDQLNPKYNGRRIHVDYGKKDRDINAKRFASFL